MIRLGDSIKIEQAIKELEKLEKFSRWLESYQRKRSGDTMLESKK